MPTSNRWLQGLYQPARYRARVTRCQGELTGAPVPLGRDSGHNRLIPGELDETTSRSVDEPAVAVPSSVGVRRSSRRTPRVNYARSAAEDAFQASEAWAEQHGLL